MRPNRLSTIGVVLLGALLGWTPLVEGSVGAVPTTLAELWILGLIWVVGWERWRAGRPMVWYQGFWPVVGLVILMVVTLIPMPPGIIRLVSPALSSVAGASYRYLTLYREGTWASGVLWLSGLGVAWAVMHLVDRQERAQQLLWWLLGVGAMVAVLGLAQRLSFTGSFLWLARPEGTSGLTGPFDRRNHLAAYLGTLVPLGLAMVVAEPGRTRRWMAGGLVGLLLLVLGMANSRGAVLALAVALGCWGFWMRRRNAVSPRVLLIGLIGGLAILPVMLGGVWSTLGSRVVESLQGETPEARWRIWRDAMGLVRGFPWTGTGAGSFWTVYPTVQSFGTPLGHTFRHAESDWVEWLVEFGLIGVGCLVGFVARWWTTVRTMLRAGRRTVPLWAIGVMGGVVYLATHAVVEFPMHNPALWILTWVLVGLSLALVRLTEETSPDQPAGERPPWRPVGRLPRMGLVMATAFLVGQLVVRGASAWMAEVQAARDAQDLTALQRAVRWQPAQLEWRLELSRRLRSVNRHREASQVLLGTVPVAPASHRPYYYLALVSAELGEEADLWFQQALAHYPMSAWYHLEWARYRLRRLHDAATPGAAPPDQEIARARIFELLQQAAALSMVHLPDVLETAVAVRGDPQDGLRVIPLEMEHQLRTGEWLADRGFWPQAHEAFQAAEHLAAGTTQVWEVKRRLVRKWLDAQRCHEAMPLLQALIEHDPQEARFVGWLGECYWRMGEWESATAALKRAAAMTREGGFEAWCRRLLAEALGAQHQYLEAAHQLELALTVAGPNARLHQLRGDMYRAAGQRELAWKAYERALAIDPNDVTTQQRLAELQTEEGAR